LASIVIGLSYDHAIDVWAVGCTLFELYTGRTLLQGRTNNEMLRLMMELKGKLPIRMLKKGSFVKDHFDDDGMFNSIEVSGDGKVRKGLCTTVRLSDQSRSRRLARRSMFHPNLPMI